VTGRKHSSLRRLTLAYYRGYIVRERYLELRSQYLQAITEGREPAPITSEEVAPEIFDISSSGIDNESKKNRTLLISSLIIALLIIVIIAIVVT